VVTAGHAAVLTPTSIKCNRVLKLILLEHKPLLACFSFVTRQKWLISVKINLRKRLNLIDVGAEVAGEVCTHAGQADSLVHQQECDIRWIASGCVSIMNTTFHRELEPFFRKLGSRILAHPPNTSSVRVNLGASFNTFRRSWKDIFLWRFCFKPNDGEPKLSRTRNAIMLAGCSQVDRQGVWYKSVNFGAGKPLISPNW
jgi:hypothetical protein